ncbi:AI-2E family transporter [Pseudomonas borbori]
MNNDPRAIALQSLIQASVFAAIAVALVVLWLAADVFLVLFAGILLALLFNGAGQLISDYSGLPYKTALAVAMTTLVTVVVGGIAFMAADVSSQLDSLGEQLPRAWERLRERTEDSRWLGALLEQRDKLQDLPQGSGALSKITGVFSSVFGSLANIVIALFIGLFLAINPRLYIDGALRLVPIGKRARIAQVLTTTGSTLRAWLSAKLLAMLLIGVCSGLGLWLIGIELALVLGLIAGLLSFIPNIGPLLSLVPALLLASLAGPDKMLWVLGLYIAIQTIESYILTPLLQQRMVNLPPALTITSQVLFGVIAGGLGVILAAPLTAALMVLTRMLYVEDLLHDRPSPAER